MKAKDIREKYLAFYEARGHRVIQSDSLVPVNDPTLLFTGAGMNQFKEYFMGIKKDMTRATSSQKCLRTGDLDNVGVTNYHHSFFEMLGNFSFADYFKRDAIVWAWEFLTKELKIPESQLQVSVHHTDDEAFDIWHTDVGRPKESITRLGDKDNFWPSNAPLEGPNGPCGPCSEIYFDQGVEFGCDDPHCSIECDCGRYAEIWNLVFTQFDRVGVNELKPLAGKNIDTGMGLERLTCVMQGKRSNFETDIFEDLIAYVKKTAQIDSLENPIVRAAVCKIVDHMRAATFSIADSAYPSNEGRGYVIRKLIRRAVWQGRTLGLHELFLAPMVGILCDTMGEQYPEIVEKKNELEQIITAEEKRFLSTLEDGVARLHQMITETKAAGRVMLSGDDVFRLYDTYGFPDELTAQISEESGITIDREGFSSCMARQRERARQGSNISGAVFDVSEAEVEIAKLDPTEFLGYEHTRAEGCVVLKLVDSTGAFVDTITASGESSLCTVVLDKTPFYAESGGQTGDSGEMLKDGAAVSVLDTKKIGDVFIHQCTVTAGSIAKGDMIDAIVGSERARVMRNHTATHLLHAALRDTLGTHVRQFGSEVRDDKFRFDFSFQRAMTKDETAQVESLVNQKIQEGIVVSKEEKSIADAQAEGATALFGEKYGETVRVVTVGDFSKELCGGTHIDNTKEIDFFKIVKESSISSGTRRIEAMTGDAARAFVKECEAKKKAAEEKRAQKEKAKQAQGAQVDGVLASGVVDTILAEPVAQSVWANVVVYAHAFDALDRTGVLQVNDAVKRAAPQGAAYVSIVCGYDAESGKTAGVVALSDAAMKSGVNAGPVAQYFAQKAQGSGGGKPAKAFFGGSEKLSQDELVKSIQEYTV